MKLTQYMEAQWANKKNRQINFENYFFKKN